MQISLHTIFLADLQRILRLLDRPLRLRSGYIFLMMFFQGLLELGFILTLTDMALALTNSVALRASPLYQAIFVLSPAIEVWTMHPHHLLLLSGVVVIVASLLKNCMNFIVSRGIALLGEDISLSVGSEIMRRFLYHDYVWHLSPAGQHTFQRMMWRGSLATMLIHLLTMYSCILTILILFLSLAGHEPILTTLMVGITSTLGIVLYRSIRRHVDKSAEEAADAAQKETHALLCSLKGIREVLIYRQQPAFLQTIVQAIRKGRMPRAFTSFAPALPTWMLEFASFVMVVLCIAFFVFAQKAETTRITAALAMLLLTAWRVLPFCNRVISLYISIRSQHPTADAVLELLAELRAAPMLNPPDPDPEFKFTQNITLQDICFHYARAEDCLHNITLTVRKGEKVGLIGPSGAGKSTLAGVLCGLCPPTAGFITVDGDLLTPPRAAAFAMQIGYVPQTPFLFAGTLADNIAFSHWGEPWEEERVREACRQAAIDFVDTHPAGLGQPIGENGVGLSGGQAQRVAIARAMYTQPTLLLFDEATSALDQANENTIQQTIDHLADSVTCVIVAHRLTTVKRCDTVIWLNEGHIVMQGQPGEVLEAYLQTQNIDSAQ